MCSNERYSLRLERDSSVLDLVVAVGEESLRLYDVVLGAIRLDKADQRRLAVQLAMAHYAIKIQRVTRAALTLVVAGQGAEAMALIREQNEFVIALNYYNKHDEEAVRFMASQVLLKRNFAEKIMAFDKKAAQAVLLLLIESHME